jgi:hypothetical protein
MRNFLVVLSVAAFAAAFAAAAPGSPAVLSCAGAGAHHARIVIQHGDGTVVSKCVAFAGDRVSGEQLLNSSGVDWSGQTFGGFGEAVCAMDGEPAQYATCPGKDFYWAVFVSRGGGSWQISGVGISSLSLADGDAEGFEYVPSVGAPRSLPAPGKCAPAATSGPDGATAGPATPTASQSATADATAEATAAPTAEATAAPTAEATADATADPLMAAVAGVTSQAGDPGGGNVTAPGGRGPGGNQAPDLGLLAASVAGGGLLGLAMLRLLSKGRARP